MEGRTRAMDSSHREMGSRKKFLVGGKDSMGNSEGRMEWRKVTLKQ